MKNFFSTNTRAGRLSAALGFAVTVSVSGGLSSAWALERPEITYTVFQFPADQIPRVDGSADDWAVVPSAYVVDTQQLTDVSQRRAKPDAANLDVRVRVGWVKGLNRLYFLYEASDDYWHFGVPGLRQDTFEIVVDGDASGGPLIDKGHKEFWKAEEVGEPAAKDDPRIRVADAHWAVHGVHAQNYHIFTPALDKDWAMAWGSPTWIKNLPWANAASRYAFKPGEGGKYVLEFWITPFDYAGPEGAQRAVESVLTENKLIGLGWIVIDYDDADGKGDSGFWVLGDDRKMYGNASRLPGFRLMPLEPALRKPIEAQWSFTVVDMERRLVAFKDESLGRVTAWTWSFGDGSTSNEQHPTHVYSEAKPNYVAILDVEGPDGKSRRSKVWDVQLK